MSPMAASEDSALDRRLEAFLDETLPVEESAEMERRLRDDGAFRARLAEVIARRDRGDHSVGAVWQRERLTCADRSTLGSYLLDVLDDDERKYLEFHLNVVGCRYCRANLDDLQARRNEQPVGRPAASVSSATADEAERRRRMFESSVGVLRKRR
jgi:hypothetical protein